MWCGRSSIFFYSWTTVSTLKQYYPVWPLFRGILPHFSLSSRCTDDFRSHTRELLLLNFLNVTETEETLTELEMFTKFVEAMNKLLFKRILLFIPHAKKKVNGTNAITYLMSAPKPALFIWCGGIILYHFFIIFSSHSTLIKISVRF